MNFLNTLFNTTEKQEIDNPAKAIIHSIMEWKKFLPGMVERDAKANNCATIDAFFNLLAINGETERYIQKTHTDLFEDLINEPIVEAEILKVKAVIIDRLNITNEETKSFVHDVIFRRMILIGDFEVPLPPLEEQYGNRITVEQATQIKEITQLILGLPGINSKTS